MTRKSSMGATPPLDPPVAGTPRLSPPKRAFEYMGYEPTPGQRLVKAKFWRAWREDPSMDPASIDVGYVAARVDAPSIRKWWLDDGFREWFLNREEFRARADAAVNLWLDAVFKRLARPDLLTMKELASVGKLLADVAGAAPGSGAEGDRGEDASRPKLTVEQQKKLIEQAASRLGWTPPKLVPAELEESNG